jgi:uncharacterized protein
VSENDERPGLTRRELFGLSGLAASTAILGGAALPSLPAQAAEPELPQVPRRTLGKTGQSVPILLMGGAMGFDPRFDPRLAEAVRFGVNYIDAADCYAGGKCETSVGAYHTRAKNRDKVWITTKSDQHEVDGFQRTVAESLTKLQTDHVDLYFLHMLRDPKYLSKDMALAAEKLKKAGKIRYFGFSCHDGNVADLLTRASQLAWIDVIMFRYNFRQYGEKELNAAIDAAHGANIGLIAMKTQGSEAGIQDAWKKFEKTGKWNKFQSVLKAVWADPRITAAVSHMDTFEKLRENVAAAVDRTSLTEAEKSALDRYAAATRSLACDGCDHICGPHVDAPVKIGDTMRYLMYHDAYNEPQKARDLFRSLPAAARRLEGVDFSGASRACPHGLDVAAHMKRAAEVLA